MHYFCQWNRSPQKNVPEYKSSKNLVGRKMQNANLTLRLINLKQRFSVIYFIGCGHASAVCGIWYELIQPNVRLVSLNLKTENFWMNYGVYNETPSCTTVNNEVYVQKEFSKSWSRKCNCFNGTILSKICTVLRAFPDRAACHRSSLASLVCVSSCSKKFDMRRGRATKKTSGRQRGEQKSKSKDY